MITFSTSGLHIPRLAVHALRPLAGVTGLAVLCAAGAYFMVLAPAQEALEVAQTAYESTRVKQAGLRQARMIQEQARHLQTELVTVWKLLPQEQKFASIAVEISELARRSRVAVPGMSYGNPKASKGLPAKASLSFSATGNYRDIYRFIQRLENTEPYLVIEKLDAMRTQDRKHKTSHAVRMNIQVTTFLKRTPPAAEGT